MGLWEDLFDRARSFFSGEEVSEGGHAKKRCYYEILEIARDATEDDIKRSYKKLALKWHPDKNPDRKDECTAYFILLQQAYEVLVDPQERAFYDKHRENIIQGSSPEEKRDTGINLYPFFQKCYQGLGDDEDGFFTIYRQLFDQLASEEFPYIEDDEDKDFPTFGTSTSDYDQVVGPFYDLWSSFCTQRSFAWLDKYNLKDAPDRYTLKAMDKENKKLREVGKKQRNEEIRNLVSYIRRRDPRVKAYRENMEARKQAEFERVEAERKKRIMKNLREFNEQETKPELTEEYLDELDKIEAELDEQFGVFACNDEDDEDAGDPYCIVCEKNFKSAKALANHQKTKKHKQAVEALKQFMAKDEQELQEDADEEVNGSVGETNEQEEFPESESTTQKPTKQSKKQKQKTKKNKAEVNPDDEDDESSVSDAPADDEPIDEAKSTKKSKKARRKQADDKKKAVPSTAGGITVPVESACMVCYETFPSRSKLFAHIQATGHAALKEPKSTKKRR